MNRLTKVESSSVLIKDGWKKKDTEKNYTSICYGCEDIAKCVNKCGFCKALDKLAAYEDTGLEPKEIKYLKAELDLIREFNALQLTEIRRYKDLEEQGLLIKLPCKLGETVFIHDGEDIEDIIEIKVAGIMYIDGDKFRCFDKYGYYIGHVGEDVFLTREEAEKALEDK